jgi:amino acid transporter
MWEHWVSQPLCSVSQVRYKNSGLLVPNCLFTISSHACTGYEASAHMAEETSSSSTSAPKGIINTCWATGWGGLALILALLFATTDISAAVNSDTGNAASQIFVTACGTELGSALSWLVVLNLFFAGVSSVTVTGRITYALTRDNAFPYSSVLSQVHSSLKSPVNAILFVFFWDALLMLLPLDTKNGSKAFYSIVGLCTIGFQVCLPTRCVNYVH